MLTMIVHLFDVLIRYTQWCRSKPIAMEALFLYASL